MAKAKKKIAEKIFNKKRNNAKKSVNPFEVHINKQKYQVLGQKLKNDRGLPGVSRARAINKRKNTLLPEYNVKHKSNKFVDRRIGEKNFSMTAEDRTMARFTAERMRHHNKKSIYNLADDEILTHRGQTLNEIEKFDDPRSDDDDDVDENGRKSSGKLDDNFVSDAHFGGGVLTKTGREGAKTHKDLIDQLIAESKKRKAEKQKTKEETLELTEKLDSEWKDLLPVISKSKKTDDDKPEVLQKPDDYDKVMRELKFEARGHPTDRLKSEDEIAKEEKERLEKLEQDRLNRMVGITEETLDTQKHRSADDLDDDFVFDSEPEDALVYDEEGKLISGHCEIKNGKESMAERKEYDQENEQEDENDDEESSDDTSDDLSDLKQIESESSDEEDKIKKKEEIKYKNKIKKNTKEKSETINIAKEKNESKDNRNHKNETLENKRSLLETSENSINKIYKNANIIKNEIEPELKNEIIEQAKKELPYTYSLPESYESLQNIFQDKSPEYQDIIIERMIKCNHPSLATENKENLSRLFIYLLQHLNDVASDSLETIDNTRRCFSVLNSLTPHLYSLTQLNPQNSLESLIEVIKEKQNDYRNKQKTYPGIDVLLFLKLIGCLFSTSDFRHQIVTPAFVFISQMLTNCKIKTRYDITYGLFLITLFLEYTALSKRYLPAVILYLIGITHMAIPKIGVRVIKVIPPFKSSCAALVLPKQYENSFDFKMLLSDFIETDFTDEFKIRVLYTTLKLCQEFEENWKNLSSEINIFKPFYDLLEKIPSNNYPEKIKNEINYMIKNYEERKKNKKINYIIMEKKKPKALRLYEPNIQQVFEFRKSKPMSREKAETEKLLYKYKKEMKGAVREIRRDKSFLGRVKIKRQIQSDYERKEKVKQIYAEASIQQSELNVLDRKRKRK